MMSVILVKQVHCKSFKLHEASAHVTRHGGIPTVVIAVCAATAQAIERGAKRRVNILYVLD